MSARIALLASVAAAFAVASSALLASPVSAANEGGTTAGSRVAAMPVDYCGNDSFDVPDRTYFFDFASACQAHDECYVLSDTPEERAVCDQEFLDDMRASCYEMWPVRGPWDLLQLRNRRTCLSYAELYYLGVRIGGLLNLQLSGRVLARDGGQAWRGTTVAPASRAAL